MSSYELKLIAVITMLIDHIGFFFFPQYGILRVVGRLSFPIFAWFIGNGIRYTHDTKLYLTRMVLFGFVSQIPYALSIQLLYPGPVELNIFFTLSIGLAAILLMRKTDRKWLKFLIVLVSAGLAAAIPTDYGAAGVLSVVAFYVYHDNIKAMFLSQTAIFGVFYTLPAIYVVTEHLVQSADFIATTQIFAVLSVALIALYNGERGPKIKYFFYLLYPVQFVVFYSVLALSMQY